MTEIKGKLDRFEEKNAIIKTADGQEISWPIKLLPDALQPGAEVTISLSPAASSVEEAKNTFAKEMLTEIFHDQNNPAS